MTEQLFQVQDLALTGVKLLVPNIRADERGFSANVYNAELFAELGVPSVFKEDFISYSKENVLRGFHFQRAPHMQDKLVRCSRGSVLDVAADYNPTSPTYGQSVSVELSGDSQAFLFIPGKYAHAFYVTSEEAMMEYKLSDTYYPELVGGVCFDDPVLSIEWPTNSPITSVQDSSWAPLPPV